MLDMTLLVLVAVIILLVAHMARFRLNPVYASPVKIALLAYLGLAFGGLLFYPDVAQARYGAGIRLSEGAAPAMPTAWTLVGAAAALLVGSMIPTWIARRPTPFGGIREVRLAIGNWAILAASVVPLVVMVAGYGPEHIWDRPTYLSEDPGPVAALGAQLGLAAVVAMGFVASRGKVSQKLLSVALVASYLTLFFSLGSRRVAMVPVLFAVGLLIASPRARNKVFAVLAAALSIYLIQLPLFLRGLPSHGIETYLAFLPYFPQEAAGLDSVARSFLISFPLIGVVAFKAPTIPMADIWTMVNPMLGVDTNWYQISHRHMLNPFTPYPAVGELVNVSTTALLLFCAIVGLIFGYFEQRIRALVGEGKQVVSLAFLGLMGLFVIFSVQYPLRQAVRMVWYAIAFDIALRVFERVRAGTKPGTHRRPIGVRAGSTRTNRG